VTFYELVDQAIGLLQERGRLSYRALKRQLALDEAGLDDLKFELIEVQGVAADHDGAILVWRGPTATASPAAESGPDRAPALTPPSARAGSPGAQAPAGAAEAAAGAGRDAAEAERRHLSVLFCDVVGSTPLATALDPEDLREVLRDYQTACAGVIELFGGVIVRQVGDGLLVNFGYPQAHEDDAARAVRAGLAIVAGMPELNARLGQRLRALAAHPLRVRIGVHTGMVVVGAQGESTYRDPMAGRGPAQESRAA
jgi:class 3 adenylate cyclase